MTIAARLVAAPLILFLLALPAAAFETTAKAAYVLDQGTGTVLLEKNASEPLPPASMSKLMTLYVAFEAIRDGRLTLDERLPVSTHAMSYKGSTMFLNTQGQGAGRGFAARHYRDVRQRRLRRDRRRR